MEQHKEEIELSALLNIYAKSKNGLEKFFQKYVSLKDFRKKLKDFRNTKRIANFQKENL